MADHDGSADTACPEGTRPDSDRRWCAPDSGDEDEVVLRPPCPEMAPPPAEAPPPPPNEEVDKAPPPPTEAPPPAEVPTPAGAPSSAGAPPAVETPPSTEAPAATEAPPPSEAPPPPPTEDADRAPPPPDMAPPPRPPGDNDTAPARCAPPLPDVAPPPPPSRDTDESGEPAPLDVDSGPSPDASEDIVLGGLPSMSEGVEAIPASDHGTGVTDGDDAATFVTPPLEPPVGLLVPPVGLPFPQEQCHEIATEQVIVEPEPIVDDVVLAPDVDDVGPVHESSTPPSEDICIGTVAAQAEVDGGGTGRSISSWADETDTSATWFMLDVAPPSPPHGLAYQEDTQVVAGNDLACHQEGESGTSFVEPSAACRYDTDRGGSSFLSPEEGQGHGNNGEAAEQAAPFLVPERSLEAGDEQYEFVGETAATKTNGSFLPVIEEAGEKKTASSSLPPPPPGSGGEIGGTFEVLPGTPVRKLSCKDCFERLSAKEKKYVCRLNGVVWAGARLVLEQTSPESLKIAELLQAACSDKAYEKVKPEGAVTERELSHFYDYLVKFWSNLGNYDMETGWKFVPQMAPASFEKVVVRHLSYITHRGKREQVMDLLGELIEPIFSLQQEDRAGHPLPRPEAAAPSANMVLKALGAAKAVAPDETHQKALDNLIARLKAACAGTDAEEEEATPCATSIVEVEVGFAKVGRAQGDAEAGDRIYRQLSEIGGEIVGLLALTSAPSRGLEALDRLVNFAEELVRELPWPEAFNEKDMKLDLQCWDVVALASPLVSSAGWMQLPMQRRIHRSGSHRCALLRNVVSEAGQEIFVAEGDAALLRQRGAKCAQMQCALEMLSSFSGRIFRKTDVENGCVEDPLAAPESAESITQCFDDDEKWEDRFGPLAVVLETFRQVAAGLCLSASERVMRAFAVDDDKEVVTCMWLQAVQSGLGALARRRAPDPEMSEASAWGLASRARASFSVLMALVRADEDFVKFEADGTDRMTVSLDSSKIYAVGIPALKRLLLKVQVYKSTGDAESMARLFDDLTFITGPKWVARHSVAQSLLSRMNPIFVQAHLEEDIAGKVNLFEFQGTAKGMILSMQYHFGHFRSSIINRDRHLQTDRPRPVPHGRPNDAANYFSSGGGAKGTSGTTQVSRVPEQIPHRGGRDAHSGGAKGASDGARQSSGGVKGSSRPSHESERPQFRGAGDSGGAKGSGRPSHDSERPPLRGAKDAGKSSPNFAKGSSRPSHDSERPPLRGANDGLTYFSGGGKGNSRPSQDSERPPLRVSNDAAYAFPGGAKGSSRPSQDYDRGQFRGAKGSGQSLQMSGNFHSGPKGGNHGFDGSWQFSGGSSYAYGSDAYGSAYGSPQFSGDARGSSYDFYGSPQFSGGGAKGSGHAMHGAPSFSGGAKGSTNTFQSSSQFSGGANGSNNAYQGSYQFSGGGGARGSNQGSNQGFYGASDFSSGAKGGNQSLDGLQFPGGAKGGKRALDGASDFKGGDKGGKPPLHSSPELLGGYGKGNSQGSHTVQAPYQLSGGAKGGLNGKNGFQNGSAGAKSGGKGMQLREHELSPKQQLERPERSERGCIKIAELNPDSGFGLNLVVKALKVRSLPQDMNLRPSITPAGQFVAEALVGDPSGSIQMRCTETQASILRSNIQDGGVVLIRNARIRMISGHMRLEVESRGTIQEAPNLPDFTPLRSYNASLTEYELISA